MDPVLIVDDDPSFLSIVTAFMGKAGWRFEIAVSGQQAIARLATNSFAAVILDLNLPDISGLDVLRAIARPPNAPPVLFISGDASVQSALEAGRFGAVEFLEKPITMSDLLTKLEACTQQRAAQEFQPGLLRRGSADWLRSWFAQASLPMTFGPAGAWPRRAASATGLCGAGAATPASQAGHLSGLLGAYGRSGAALNASALRPTFWNSSIHSPSQLSWVSFQWEPLRQNIALVRSTCPQPTLSCSFAL